MAILFFVSYFGFLFTVIVVHLVFQYGAVPKQFSGGSVIPIPNRYRDILQMPIPTSVL